jgi:hypothetical protein
MFDILVVDELAATDDLNRASLEPYQSLTRTGSY